MMSTRRAFLSAGSASAIALSLAACSRSQPKTAETVASGTPIAEPVLNDKQLEEFSSASRPAWQRRTRRRTRTSSKRSCPVRQRGSVPPSTPPPPPAETAPSSTP